MAYQKAEKAFFTLEKLIKLRKDQESNKVQYEVLMAPLYYKIGDYLATYILINTDEFGNVRPLEDASDSEEEVDEPEIPAALEKIEEKKGEDEEEKNEGP